jgi:hypothetical protein
LKKLLQISEEVVKQHNEERGMMTYVTLMEAHLIERLSKTLNDLNKALTLLESAKYALEIEGALDEEWNAKVVALLKASVDRKRDQLGAE